MRALSYIGAEKITFLPKPDRHQTDGHNRLQSSFATKNKITYLFQWTCGGEGEETEDETDQFPEDRNAQDRPKLKLLKVQQQFINII